MPNKKISELVKVTSSNATDEYVLSRGVTNVSIQSQYISALSASYALTASYAVSSSVEIKKEVTSSYDETASYAYSTTILSGSASDARNELVTKISGSSIAPISSLSASLTVTDQTISSSVALLSGSASDARNLIVADNLALSASLTLTNQAISSSVATLSSSAASALTTYSSSAASYLTTYSASAATYLSSSITTATVLTSSFSETSSFSNTSSYSLTSVSASHSLTASYAISSSHEITHEISSSYAETASYALNSGVITNPTTGSIPLNISGAFVDSPITVVPAVAGSTGGTGSVLATYTNISLINTEFIFNFPTSALTGDLFTFVSTHLNTLGNVVELSDGVGNTGLFQVIRAYVDNSPLSPTTPQLRPVTGSTVLPTTFADGATISFRLTTTSTGTPGLTHITGSTFGESISGSFTGSFLGNLEGSASYALTASYALNGGGGGSSAFPSEYVTSNTNAEKGKTYVFDQPTAYTLTLPLSPSDGDSIQISNRSSITGNILGRNGELIMGSANDLTLDLNTVSFILTYTSGAQGWVIIGAVSGTTTGSAESIWYDGGTFISSSADVRITGSMSVNGSIEYSNVYSTVNDLPSATQYHGMFAHVHSNGQAYFSHAGQWVKLATTYSSTYITSNTTAEENKVYVFEQSTPYTLTLPLSPSDGDSIYISNRSNITTNSVNGNGEKIMGDTQNLNLDRPTAAFRLMYTTGNQGWVVLGSL